MDLDERIKKLATALKYTKPDKCEGCKFIEAHKDGEYTNFYCSLIDDSYESCINFELDNEDINLYCPLLEKDSEEYNEIVEQLELLVELKEARIKLQKLETIKGGRYNGKRALAILEEIERIAREAFNDPETQDINLYRAQALANIYAIFEYDGATIKREEGGYYENGERY